MSDTESTESAPSTSAGDTERWQEYVEGELMEAEEHIEEAIRASEHIGQRSELLAVYRHLIGILYRYYDNHGLDVDLDPDE